MEATGIYYLDLAIALSNAGLPVSVINPKSFHNFAKLTLTNSKTDGIDAQLLAEFGERMTPRLWVAPTADHLALRAMGRHLNRLTGHRVRAKNELHALQATGTTVSILIEDEEEAIAFFDTRIERIRKAAREQIMQCPELSLQFSCMLAAPGVGEVSAITMLAELATLQGLSSRHRSVDMQAWMCG